MRTLVRAETWPIRGGFRIARGTRAAAEVLVVELEDAGALGRGECVPYARYGESLESVRREIEATVDRRNRLGLREAVEAMSAGAARNALDCALWDLEAKRTGRPAWELVGLGAPPGPTPTMRTVSVGSPEEMSKAAASLPGAKAIKVKVDGGPDLDRIAAVHEGAPGAELVVDANESWSARQLAAWLPELSALGVTVLEQPLPAGNDVELEGLRGAVPFCADESFHHRDSFVGIERRYELVNIKLDKTGGLSEAIRCLHEARRRGLGVMLGCMVSTSLAIEPALLLAAGADYIDLDGPLLLDADRVGALHDATASLLRPSGVIWGAP